MLPPGTNAEDNKGLSMNIASQNSVILIEGPEDVGAGVYSGFESGDFFSWSAPGDREIPTEYEGNTNLAPQRFSWVDTEVSKKDCGAEFFLNGQCQLTARYWADGTTWDLLEPPFEFREAPYDPRIRPWYVTAIDEDQNVWSEPYADFDTGASFISGAVLLKNQAEELVGVAACDVVLSTIALDLVAAAEESGASAIYVMDSSDQNLLVLSSIPDTAFDAEGVQVPALESGDVVIKESAAAVIGGKTNGKVFVSEVDGAQAFIQAIAVDEIGTLPFKDGVSWIYVIVAPAVCEDGLVLDSAQAACVPA